MTLITSLIRATVLMALPYAKTQPLDWTRPPVFRAPPHVEDGRQWESGGCVCFYAGNHMGQLGIPELVEVVAGTVAIVTAIFHAAMYIGKLSVRMSRAEDRIDDHDERIDRLVETRNR